MKMFMAAAAVAATNNQPDKRNAFRPLMGQKKQTSDLDQK